MAPLGTRPCRRRSPPGDRRAHEPTCGPPAARTASADRCRSGRGLRTHLDVADRASGRPHPQPGRRRRSACRRVRRAVTIGRLDLVRARSVERWPTWSSDGDLGPAARRPMARSSRAGAGHGDVQYGSVGDSRSTPAARADTAEHRRARLDCHRRPDVAPTTRARRCTAQLAGGTRTSPTAARRAPAVPARRQVAHDCTSPRRRCAGYDAAPRPGCAGRAPHESRRRECRDARTQAGRRPTVRGVLVR